jgi:hypothetical protein
MLNGDRDPPDGYVEWANFMGADPYSGGQGASYGLGRGYEWQTAALTNRDQLEVSGAASQEHINELTPWAVPGDSVGSITTTPSLAPGVQSVFNSPSYVQGDPIGFFLTEALLGSPNGQRYFAQKGHPTRAPAELTVVWRRRRISII